ncbi:MAG: GSCFA domain-containing protein [Flavobacteriales bacterium]|nr:GSCFA domain-containing protein [Flavobacteriales bacterium]
MTISLTTSVKTPANARIGQATPLLFLGSCFAERIGDHFYRAGFQTVVNPWGVIYNPASLLKNLRSAGDHSQDENFRLIQHQEVWHSMDHHSYLSSLSREETWSNIHRSNQLVQSLMPQKPVVVITLGTSMVYEMNGEIVANCHKLPGSSFYKRRLSVAEVVSNLKEIQSILTGCKVIFTVSPVRHIRDGLHENQLNKAVLLLAVDQIVQSGEDALYFPAYEIMMDELRDYRYYDSDLIHPSETATAIIFNRFLESMCSSEARDRMTQWNQLERSLNHRPFNPESQQHKSFRDKLNSDLMEYFARFDVPEYRRQQIQLQYHVRT